MRARVLGEQRLTSAAPDGAAARPACPRAALASLLAALVTVILAVMVGLACPRDVAAKPNAGVAAQAVQRGCGAPEITRGPERTLLNQIEQRFDPVIKADGRHNIYVALIKSNTINSWETSVDATHFLVCIPLGMVRFMGDAEGELAFVVGHETGHALDDQCRTAEGRLAVAKSQGSLAAAVGQLLGGPKEAYELSGLAQEKGCEERADRIGFMLIARAGYNPFDAAGAFGRLEMYSGDTGGVLNQVKALGSGHPVTADRISHMRELLLEELKKEHRLR